jgi:hypothetical protein
MMDDAIANVYSFLLRCPQVNQNLWPSHALPLNKSEMNGKTIKSKFAILEG